jgi:predicted RNA-binding Zn-ribbon protein involved in translation (DUF1610 family)
MPIAVFVGIIIFWGIVNLFAESAGASPVLEFINNIVIPFVFGLLFLAMPIGIIYALVSNSRNYDGTIKCGNCGYLGVGKKGRSAWAQILVWLLIIFFWPITLLYYVLTHAYACPNCNSTFVGLRDKNGFYSAPKGGGGALGIVVVVIIAIAVIGILAAVVLGSLNDAREAASEASKKALNSETSFDLEQELKKTEKQLNSLFDLPAMVDEDTRLDRIFLSDDNKLNYTYTLVDFSSSEFVPGELEGYVLSGLRELYCEDLDMAFYRTNNVPMKWSYYGNDQLLIDSFELTNYNCL